MVLLKIKVIRRRLQQEYCIIFRHYHKLPSAKTIEFYAIPYEKDIEKRQFGIFGFIFVRVKIAKENVMAEKAYSYHRRGYYRYVKEKKQSDFEYPFRFCCMKRWKYHIRPIEAW